MRRPPPPPHQRRLLLRDANRAPRHPLPLIFDPRNPPQPSLLRPRSFRSVLTPQSPPLIVPPSIFPSQIAADAPRQPSLHAPSSPTLSCPDSLRRGRRTPTGHGDVATTSPRRSFSSSLAGGAAALGTAVASVAPSSRSLRRRRRPGGRSHPDSLTSCRSARLGPEASCS